MKTKQRNPYKEARAGRSYSELARMTSAELQKRDPNAFITGTTIRGWELGESEPGFRNLAAFARAVGKPLDFFDDGTEPNG